MVYPGSAPGGIEIISGIIPATSEHVPGMLAVQQSCSLADKVEAGMDRRDIERGGFLVHMLTADDFEQIVTDPEVTTRVHVGEDGKVGGYAVGFPLTTWKAQNPDWAGAIILDEGIAPDPPDDKTALLRYVAAGPNAVSGTGLVLNRTVVDLFGARGFEAIVGEVMATPYHNRPATVVNTRVGFRKVGHIDETYGGQDYTWSYIRKTYGS